MQQAWTPSGNVRRRWDDLASTAPQSARQGTRAGGGKSMLSHTKAIEIASRACPEMVKAGAMPCVFVYPEHFVVSWTRVGALKAPQIHITRGNGSWRHA